MDQHFFDGIFVALMIASNIMSAVVGANMKRFGSDFEDKLAMLLICFIMLSLTAGAIVIGMEL